jgi:hypothetical protein
VSAIPQFTFRNVNTGSLATTNKPARRDSQHLQLSKIAFLANRPVKEAAMAPILTAEDVVRRIAAECVYVDERGAVVARAGKAETVPRLNYSAGSSMIS